MRDMTSMKFSMLPLLPQLEFSCPFLCIVPFVLPSSVAASLPLGAFSQFFPVSLHRYTVRWYRRNLQQLQRGSRDSRPSYPLHPRFLGLTSPPLPPAEALPPRVRKWRWQFAGAKFTMEGNR